VNDASAQMSRDRLTRENPSLSSHEQTARYHEALPIPAPSGLWDSFDSSMIKSQPRSIRSLEALSILLRLFHPKNRSLVLIGEH
jgi:hypothetical protein